MIIKDGIIQDNTIEGVPFRRGIVPRVTGYHRPGSKYKKTSITNHNTDNTNTTATADAHQRLLRNSEAKRTNRTGGFEKAQTSYHFVIDDKEIIQCLPITETSHCQGHLQGNRTSISIEICDNFYYTNKSKYNKAIDNAIKLNRQLSKATGITKIVQHNYWTGKNCPSKIRRDGKWNWFLTEIQKGSSSTTTTSNSKDRPILGSPTTTIHQMKEWAKSKKASQEFIDLAPIFYEVSIKEGVDPAVTYTQSAKETGYMKFGGVLDSSFKNPCGLKTRQGGGDKDPNAHQRFNSWEEGILAQVEHLALYAGAKGYPKNNPKDPRHFDFCLGKAKTVKALGGNWAPSPQYGSEILQMMDGLYTFPKGTAEDNIIKKPVLTDTVNLEPLEIVLVYSNDGDLANVQALANGLVGYGKNVFIYRTNDVQGIKAEHIIQVGGGEIKGTVTDKIIGKDRQETLVKIGHWIKENDQELRK